MLKVFENSFADRLIVKFATDWSLNIPPHRNFVATLPCEIWMSENWWQSVTSIMINDKSQGSTAKHISCDGLLHHQFKLIVQCAGERMFKIGEHLAKLHAKWLIVSCAPCALDFCHEGCRTRQINKITVVWRTEIVTNYYVNRQIKKGKGSPYSITERRVPELIPVLGSQPAADVSHKPGGRLPLLSAKPAVTPTTLKRAATNLLLGEQRHNGCEQFA